MASASYAMFKQPFDFRIPYERFPPSRGAAKEALNVNDPICARRPAGHHSHFQPRLYHRSGVYTAVQGAVCCLLSRMTRASAPGRRFLKLPEGFGTVVNCQARKSVTEYIGALRTVSRPLAGSWLCPSAVPFLRCAREASGTTATTPAEPPGCRLRQSLGPQPDAASLNPKPSDIQVGGKQYTKVAGLTWVRIQKPDSFADVSVGPNDLESKDKPTPLAERPAALPPKTGEARSATRGADSGTVEVKTAPQRGHTPPQYAPKPEPLKAIVDVVMLPWDFLAYPGRRDW